MSTDRSEPLLQLLAALEKDCALTTESVEAVLGTTLTLRRARDERGTELFIEVSRSDLTMEQAEPTLPGGSWSPPPPPGWGPADAGPVYWVERPCGLLGLAFRSDGTLARLSLAAGRHGFPGI